MEVAACRVLSRRYNSLENLAVLKLNTIREEVERREDEEEEGKKETLQTTSGEQETILVTSK